MNKIKILKSRPDGFWEIIYQNQDKKVITSSEALPLMVSLLEKQTMRLSFNGKKSKK